MTRHLHLAAIPICFGLAGALANAAPASAAPSGKACFFAHELSSWKEAGDKTVNLRVGIKDVYQLQLLGPCPDLPYAEAIGIETRGGSRRICSGLDINLIVPGNVTHGAPRRCMATSLRKLTKEEVSALPPKEKP